MLDSFRARFVPHGAGLRPMADEFSPLQRYPLPGIARAMRSDPLLLIKAISALGRTRQIGDRHEDMLPLLEGQRLKGTQDSMFIHRFQLSDHESIVISWEVRSATGNALCAVAPAL